MDPNVKAGVVAQIKTLLAMYANESNWKAGYGATADAVAANTKKVILLGIQKLQSSLLTGAVPAGLQGALRQLFVNTFKGVEFTGMTKLFAIDPKPIVETSKTLVDAYNRVFHPIQQATTFTKLFGDKNKIAADTVAFFKQKMDEANTGMTSYEAAIQAGVDKYNDLVTSTELGIVTTNKYRQALVQSVGSQVGFSNAAKMSTSDLELNRKAMLGDTDAIKALNDALTNAAKTGFGDFIESTKKILGEKKFGKLGFVDTFERIQKEADKFQAGFIKSMDKGGTEAAKAFAIKFSQTPKKFIKPRDIVAFDS